MMLWYAHDTIIQNHIHDAEAAELMQSHMILNNLHTISEWYFQKIQDFKT